jgi:hypothetical protein
VGVYQFHFLGHDGRRPMLDFAECPDDGAAAREAFGQLNQHASAIGLEVWLDDRMIMRMDRPAPPTAPGLPAIHGVR